MSELKWKSCVNTNLNHGVWVLVGSLVDGVTEGSSRAVTLSHHIRWGAVTQLTPCPEQRREKGVLQYLHLTTWSLTMHTDNTCSQTLLTKTFNTVYVPLK